MPLGMFFLFLIPKVAGFGMAVRLKAIRFGLVTKPNDVEFGIAVRFILNK
jgi:hypothetical protein